MVTPFFKNEERMFLHCPLYVHRRLFERPPNTGLISLLEESSTQLLGPIDLSDQPFHSYMMSDRSRRVAVVDFLQDQHPGLELVDRQCVVIDRSNSVDPHHHQHAASSSIDLRGAPMASNLLLSRNMSTHDSTPKKKCMSINAPSAPKKLRIDLGLDMSPLGFDFSNEPFTETQVETPEYYDKQNGVPFNNVQYGTFYPVYDPAPPQPQIPVARDFFPVEPTPKRKIATSRRREDVPKTQNLQRFSTAMICHQCDKNASFDGTTLKIRLCRPCLVKIGTNIM